MKKLTIRLSRDAQKKLQERSAVLYTRALERWNTRRPVVKENETGV